MKSTNKIVANALKAMNAEYDLGGIKVIESPSPMHDKMKKLIKSGNADEAFSIFLSRNWVENDDYRKFENKFISCQGKLDAGKALSSSDVSALTKLADNLLLKK